LFDFVLCFSSATLKTGDLAAKWDKIIKEIEENQMEVKVPNSSSTCDWAFIINGLRRMAVSQTRKDWVKK
jgi:hypothetical protein